jgi:hypothetical protein
LLGGPGTRIKMVILRGRNMAKREHSGVYQKRFDMLWAMLLVIDPRGIVDISPGMIAGVIGCSEDYARRLLFNQCRFIVCRK